MIKYDYYSLAELETERESETSLEEREGEGGGRLWMTFWVDFAEC